jgi:serine/threonine protein phosphatase 1
MGRTIAIGDIHGDLLSLWTLLERLPALTAQDTLVFLGDYIDRGPDSAGVVRHIREVLPTQTSARVVALRGNHEDAWLRVCHEGWDAFVLPPGNGCRACARSFLGLPPEAKLPREAIISMFEGGFFPPDVVAWMEALPHWYEDEHAIYVHAGVPRVDGRWLHPSEVEDAAALLWTRAPAFFLEYDGKPIVVGHTGTSTLPQDRSLFTPDDHHDVFWSGRSAYAIDTMCGKGGFLSAIEFPSYQIFESR